MRARRVLATTALLMLAGLFTAGEHTSASEIVPAEARKAGPSDETRSVAARVNGRPVYDDDVGRLAEMNFSKLRRFASDRPTPDLLKDLRKGALQELIAVELLVQAGETLKLSDIDARVETRLGKGHAAAPDEAEAQDNLRRSILVDEYLKHAGVTDPKIPESEIRAYYDTNKEHYRRRDAVHVRHILIRLKNDADADERSAARRKIEKARDEIRGGKDFGEAARKYSEDNAASFGGDIGYRERGFMPDAFDAVAFSLKKNRLSDVIETPFGYHIMEILDRIPAGIPAYGELRGFFERYLWMEESRRRKAELIDILRAQARIEITGRE